MNNFYASVECVLDPSIKDKPVAVCGNEKERHGIVLAKNYFAKNFGVKTGDPIWQAKNKCKNLIIIDAPHFDKYMEYSNKAKELYLKYTDLVEPMGLDECWLDVTHSIKLFGSGKAIADELRENIKRKFGLTISVGVSFNKTFAKLGSDMKKPDATTVITKDNFKELVWPLPVESLIGVGYRTKKLLNKFFIKTIGDLANETKERLEYLMGKNGITLYNAANGIEDDDVQNFYELDKAKSISHGITTVRDLNNNYEVWNVMLELTQEIALKLRQSKLRAGGVYISIRDSKLYWQQYRRKLKTSEISAYNIAKFAFELFKEKYSWEDPVRNITVGVMQLVNDTEPIQMNIFDNFYKTEKIEKIEKVMQNLNMKYKNEVVTTATLMKNNNLPKNRRKVNYDKK